MRAGPAPAFARHHRHGLLLGEFVHATQMGAQVGDTVRHVATDGARCESFVDLSVQYQRAAVLVDAAAVFARQARTWGRTQLRVIALRISATPACLFI